jgi:hypothetical protein
LDSPDRDAHLERLLERRGRQVAVHRGRRVFMSHQLNRKRSRRISDSRGLGNECYGRIALRTNTIGGQTGRRWTAKV